MELVGACVKQPNLALVQPLMLRGSLYDALHGAKKLDPTKYTWKLYLKIANDIASGKLIALRVCKAKNPFSTDLFGLL